MFAAEWCYTDCQRRCKLSLGSGSYCRRIPYHITCCSWYLHSNSYRCKRLYFYRWCIGLPESASCRGCRSGSGDMCGCTSNTDCQRRPDLSVESRSNCRCTVIGFSCADFYLYGYRYRCEWVYFNGYYRYYGKSIASSFCRSGYKYLHWNTVTIFASGGGAYSWDPGAIAASQLTLSPSVTTDYTVTVTDQNGCTASDQMTLTVHPLPLADAGLNANICIGDAVSFTASGGELCLGSGRIEHRAPESQSGTFFFLYSYRYRCQWLYIDRWCAVQVNPLPLAQTSATDVQCNGGADGTATVIPSAGTSPYSYSWSPSGGSNAPSKWTYKWQLHSNGDGWWRLYCYGYCKYRSAYTCSVVNVCISGFVSRIRWTGFPVWRQLVVPGYTYRWSPSGSVNDTAFLLLQEPIQLPLQMPMVVQRPFQRLWMNHPRLSWICQGLTRDVMEQVPVLLPWRWMEELQGYSYSWSPVSGNNFFSSAIPIGTYTVLVTDAHACSSSASYVINQPTALQLSVASTPATYWSERWYSNSYRSGRIACICICMDTCGGNGSTTTGLPTEFIQFG